MKKSIFFIFVCICTSSVAWCEDFPTMLGVKVKQIGDQKVCMEVSGISLPFPEIRNSGEGESLLKWPGVLLPAKKWEKDYPFPLLFSVRAWEENGHTFMNLLHEDGMHISLKDGGNGKKHISLVKILQKEREPLIQKRKETTNFSEYSKPISLSLREVSLTDVFRLFAEFWGVNLLLDDSVPQKNITLTLKNLPADVAFGYILKTQGLRFATLGDTTLWIGSSEDLGKKLGMVRTKAYHLAYSDVIQVRNIIMRLTGLRKVVEDKRRNFLYITAVEDDLLKVEELLSVIDHPGKQVMIEARIVEVSDRAGEEVASCIDSIYRHWLLEYQGGGSPGKVRYQYSSGEKDSPVVETLTGTMRKLDVLLSMLEKEEKGHVLAEPSVIAVEGTKAKIRLVQKYPYVSVRDEAGNPSYVSEEVGPQLEMTPFIGRDQIVTIDLAIRTGEVLSWREGARGETYPETSTREVETTVRIRDGEPFVIGGLFKEQKRENHYKVPVLGDVPFLGTMFASHNTEKEKNEVIVIVIPHILHVSNSAP